MTSRFDPAFVQTVRDAIDLVDLVAEQTKVERKGQRYQALCPFHKEKTPSFSIDSAQGLYYCFGCGAGGDAIGFHMRITGDDFGTAIESLARRYGIPVPSRGAANGRDPRLDERVLGLAARFFADRLERAEAPRAYLASRSIPEEMIDAFTLGYAPDEWQGLLDALAERVGADELERAGLVARSEGGRLYDRFRNRLMFPIRSPAGRLVGFGGRALGDDRAKYINTRETGSFQKSSLLYGLDRAKAAIRERRKVLLVEGYFDVIGSVISGIDWVVASMGTALTERQVRILKRYADEVIVGYDGDRAGEEASRKALRSLLAAGLVARRARFPAGQDPDSLRQEEGGEAVRKVVEEAPDAIDLEIERLPRGLETEPRLQAREAARIGSLLASLPNPVLRFGYGRKAAERLGLPEEVLWQAAADRKASAASGGGSRRDSSAAAESAEAPARGSVPTVTSLEERALELLLTRPMPAVDPLPSEELFLDAKSRAIYAAYRDVAARTEAGERVTADALVNRLEDDREAIDRVARLLLQDSLGGHEEELAECLRRLDLRWKKRRSEQLRRELVEAERAGDDERFAQLLEQKLGLSRQIHRARD